MKSKPGTYALVLRSLKSTSTQIGRRGGLRIVPGYYIYVGSAFGPGGVQARITRHCRKTKSKHWHIDYLREHVNPVFAWYSNEPIHLEHRWAQA
jgi:Uri superfamily endonuclease